MKRPTFNLASVRKRLFLQGMNEKRSPLTKTVRKFSVWLILLRLFQSILAFSLLSLTIVTRYHLLDVHPLSTDVLFFAFALSTLYTIWITLSYFHLRYIGHAQNQLGRILFLLFEFMVVLAWFVAFIFLCRDARLIRGRGLYVYDSSSNTDTGDGTTNSTVSAVSKRQYYDEDYGYDNGEYGDGGYDGGIGYHPDDGGHTSDSADNYPLTFVYFSDMTIMCMDTLAGLCAVEFLACGIGFLATLTTLYRAGRALEARSSRGLALQSIYSHEDPFHDSAAIVTTLPPVYEPSVHLPQSTGGQYFPNAGAAMGYEVSGVLKKSDDIVENEWEGVRSANAGKLNDMKSMPRDRNGKEKSEYGRLVQQSGESRGRSPVIRI